MNNVPPFLRMMAGHLELADGWITLVRQTDNHPPPHWLRLRIFRQDDVIRRTRNTLLRFWFETDTADGKISHVLKENSEDSGIID